MSKDTPPAVNRHCECGERLCQGICGGRPRGRRRLCDACRTFGHRPYVKRPARLRDLPVFASPARRAKLNQAVYRLQATKMRSFWTWNQRLEALCSHLGGLVEASPYAFWGMQGRINLERLEAMAGEVEEAVQNGLDRPGA